MSFKDISYLHLLHPFFSLREINCEILIVDITRGILNLDQWFKDIS